MLCVAKRRINIFRNILKQSYLVLTITPHFSFEISTEECISYIRIGHGFENLFEKIVPEERKYLS